MSFVGHIEKHALTIGENQGSQAKYNRAGNFSARRQPEGFAEARRQAILDGVVAAVEQVTCLPWADITSKRQKQHLVAARAAVAHFMRKTHPEPWNLNQVALMLSRDHTTIMHYEKKARFLLDNPHHDNFGFGIILGAVTCWTAVECQALKDWQAQQ